MSLLPATSNELPSKVSPLHKGLNIFLWWHSLAYSILNSQPSPVFIQSTSLCLYTLLAKPFFYILIIHQPSLTVTFHPFCPLSSVQSTFLIPGCFQSYTGALNKTILILITCPNHLSKSHSSPIEPTLHC